MNKENNGKEESWASWSRFILSELDSNKVKHDKLETYLERISDKLDKFEDYKLNVSNRLFDIQNEINELRLLINEIKVEVLNRSVDYEKKDFKNNFKNMKFTKEHVVSSGVGGVVFVSLLEVIKVIIDYLNKIPSKP